MPVVAGCQWHSLALLVTASHSATGSGTPVALALAVLPLYGNLYGHMGMALAVAKWQNATGSGKCCIAVALQCSVGLCGTSSASASHSATGGGRGVNPR
jgi:hypothetical protein